MSSQEAVSRSYLHHGVEVFFVKQPPQELQLECSICLQLLAKPCILDCDCGASFCKNCIEKVQNCCPLCNQNFTIILPNKQLQRTLNGLLIYCSRSSDGCSWTGELVKLKEHLNRRPSKEMRLAGCGFTDVACQYCNELFPRKEVESHENETCPNKPYTCEYCGHFSVLDDITQNHWLVCLMIPILCPYECGENPQRQNLNRHVEKDCSLVPVRCEFAYAGCCVDITRGSVADHMINNVAQHMTLMSCQHSKDLKAVEYVLKEEIKALKKEVVVLKEEEIKALKEEVVVLKEDEIKALKEEVVVLKKDNKRIKDECLSLREDHNSLKWEVESLKAESTREEVEAESNCEYQLECLTKRIKNLEKKQQAAAKSSPGPMPPVKLVVENMRSLRQQRNSWISKPFYSRSHYKMVLEVIPYGNGDGCGTYLSVFIHIIKGEYDSQLKWPFVGEVIITLIDQRQGKNRTSILKFTRTNSFGKRQLDDSHTNGHGWPKVMESKFLNPDYQKDNCLEFCIDNIK